MAGLLVAGMAMPGRAAEWSASVGASFSEHDWTPAATLEAGGYLRALGERGLQWRPVAALTVVDGHAHDWRAGTDKTVWVGSGGAAFSLRDGGWFLALQAGAASRTTPALSSHLQFVSSLGWQGRRLRLQLRHISNGRIGGGPNLGESMALMGVRF